MNSRPNYNKIYIDLITKKFPEKKELFLPILNEKQMSMLDVIEINNKLFGKSKHSFEENQRHRSYDKESILKILDYQKDNKLNNSELARHFNLSRNTIHKWKKKFFSAK